MPYPAPMSRSALTPGQPRGIASRHMPILCGPLACDGRRRSSSRVRLRLGLRRPSTSHCATGLVEPTGGDDARNAERAGKRRCSRPDLAAGVDTAGIIAQQNLDAAADIVITTLRQRPGAVLTQSDFESSNSNLVFDNPGTPTGGPGTVGTAVISTGVDRLPGSPRRVVLAFPGNDACYYVSVAEGRAKQYGVARGADAASHCFVGEIGGGVPQVRHETTWTDRWPPPTS